MHGKRVQFDDDTWHAIEAVADETGSTFPELAAEAFVDLLRKHHQPVGFFCRPRAKLGRAWEPTQESVQEVRDEAKECRKTN
jgi:hypothetical protein